MQYIIKKYSKASLDVSILFTIFTTARIHHQCPIPHNAILHNTILPPQHHLCLLQYILALFILLTLLICHIIFPPQHTPTRTTLDITHPMHPSYQHPLFQGTLGHIHHLTKQIRSPMPPLKCFRHQLLVISSMRPTGPTRINNVPRQVLFIQYRHC